MGQRNAAEQPGRWGDTARGLPWKVYEQNSLGGVGCTERVPWAALEAAADWEAAAAAGVAAAGVTLAVLAAWGALAAAAPARKLGARVGMEGLVWVVMGMEVVAMEELAAEVMDWGSEAKTAEGAGEAVATAVEGWAVSCLAAAGWEAEAVVEVVESVAVEWPGYRVAAGAVIDRVGRAVGGLEVAGLVTEESAEMGGWVAEEKTLEQAMAAAELVELAAAGSEGTVVADVEERAEA
jgi:hypothetical protein